MADPPVQLVDDLDVENLEQGELLIRTFGSELYLHGNDLKLERVTVPIRVVPAGEIVEAAPNHGQGVAQVLLAVLAPPCQVGEVCRDPRASDGE